MGDMKKADTIQINESLRADLDGALRCFKKISRKDLINPILKHYVSKFPSLRQKKQYIDQQIHLINEECMEASGFYKYELKRGYQGGHCFTKAYLDFIGNQGDYVMDEVEGEEEEVFNPALESRIERIEKLLKEIKTIIRKV